jgi:hypothetical protein
MHTNNNNFVGSGQHYEVMKFVHTNNINIVAPRPPFRKFTFKLLHWKPRLKTFPKS